MSYYIAFSFFAISYICLWGSYYHRTREAYFLRKHIDYLEGALKAISDSSDMVKRRIDEWTLENWIKKGKM